MTVVCPTVTAFDTIMYRKQLEEIKDFAPRIHIDFMDGDFAPSRSPNIEQAWWPSSLIVDFHIMYRHPLKQLETIITMQPHLIIIHAEAEGVKEFLTQASGLGIKLGLALLKDTPAEVVTELLTLLNHVLVFSGDLGHFGGNVDLGLLDKVSKLKNLKPELEIGWDGGINLGNAKQLADGGVDVLNTGGFIHDAADAETAYNSLVEALRVAGGLGLDAANVHG